VRSSSSSILAVAVAVLLSAGSFALVACGDDDSAGAAATGGAAGTAAGGAAAGQSATAGAGGGTSGGEAGASAAGAGGAAGGGALGATGEPQSITVGGDRPAKVYVPSSYDPAKPTPLVVLLHGYGASGSLQELYLNIKKQAEEQGFLYVNPDGTTDASGKRFWNATKACCDYGDTGVDDEGYLMSLLDEIAAKANVDPKRVHFFGHSNGGFMTYRMACNHADRIAAVGVLAGAMPIDASQCAPSGPVSVLHVHGTADETIAYEGGSVAAGIEAYPGAQESVGRWLITDSCAEGPFTESKADFEANLPGEDTTERVSPGCGAGTAVDLWSIEGGKHIPGFNTAFTPAAMTWLLAHPKTN
jgi:polyhydroxybutyrate depolymerase